MTFHGFFIKEGFMSQIKKSSIGKNAAILGLAGIIVKIFGAIYRIPMTALIKDVGIGYFQSAYPIYEIMLAISTAGLPVAVSTIVSREIAKENYLNSKKTFKVAFWFMAFLGMLLALLLWIFAKPLVNFLGNPGSYYSMLALIPAMVFSPPLAAMRGYYQGLELMTSTAISQIIVQGTRVATGLYLCYLLIPYGLEASAGGASAGAGIGAFLGVMYMLLVHKKHRREVSDSLNTNKEKAMNSKVILSELIKIAIPISIGAAIMPIMDTIDIRLVMKGLLKAGFSIEEANLRFGWLKGMAQTLISLPQVIGIALGVSMIPVVSKLFTLKNEDKLVNKVSSINKITLFIAFPAMFGLFSLSEPIIRLLYGSTGAEAIEGTAKILRILSISIPALMLINVNTSILQAVGKEKIPVINLVIGGVFKIILTYILTQRPDINVYGAAIGTVVSFTITGLLDIYYVKKKIGLKMASKTFISVVASALMGGAAYMVWKALSTKISSNIATLAAVIVGAVIYVAILFGTKTVTKKDLEEIRE